MNLARQIINTTGTLSSHFILIKQMIFHFSIILMQELTIFHLLEMLQGFLCFVKLSLLNKIKRIKYFY